MQTFRYARHLARKLSLIGAFIALAAVFTLPHSASAQLFGRQEPAGDTAELLLRVDRLENQIRNLNGQLEQMQFQLRRSEEQLKKFQADVDFRLQELQPKGGARPASGGAASPPQRRTDLEPETVPNSTLAEVIPGPRAAGAPGGSTPRAGRGDAFDPGVNPEAPGAPRALGSAASASLPPGRITPAGPLGAETDANAPLDLAGRARRDSVAALPAQSNGPPAQTQPAAATLPPTTPRDEFDLAFFTLERGQYESAENGFRTFLQRYPKDGLSGEATYFLGESFFRRGKHRDAAEQYLKISTDFPKTARAPDALLRLGQSLEKLGAKEQACAFYAEVPRKFPAAATVKASALREAKRAQC